MSTSRVPGVTRNSGWQAVNARIVEARLQSQQQAGASATRSGPAADDGAPTPGSHAGGPADDLRPSVTGTFGPAGPPPAAPNLVVQPVVQGGLDYRLFRPEAPLAGSGDRAGPRDEHLETDGGLGAGAGEGQRPRPC